MHVCTVNSTARGDLLGLGCSRGGRSRKMVDAERAWKRGDRSRNGVDAERAWKRGDRSRNGVEGRGGDGGRRTCEC